MKGEAQPPLDLDGMEGEAQPPSACVSKVLDDDNLLPEIIVRVGFPTSLVRVAGVCRRWLSHASDRAFLRRFRELHPPRLLGFYLALWLNPAATRFLPMLPQPPEFAAVIRRANFRLETYERSDTNAMMMVVCRNGSVVTSSRSIENSGEEIAFACAMREECHLKNKDMRKAFWMSCDKGTGLHSPSSSSSRAHLKPP